MLVVASNKAAIATDYNFSSYDSIYTLQGNIGEINGIVNINEGTVIHGGSFGVYTSLGTVNIGTDQVNDSATPQIYGSSAY